MNLKTGRSDNTHSAVIISSVSKASAKLNFGTALLTLLMMTAESIRLKCPVLRFTAALFFSKRYFRVIFRQPCYAQPIQAKLIPDCQDSFLHCFTWTSRLHLFSRLCPIFSRRLAPNKATG